MHEIECIENVPEVFRFDDSGKSEAYDQTGASADKIQAAIDVCPVSCIHLEGITALGGCICGKMEMHDLWLYL
jgi:ferredoxin